MDACGGACFVLLPMRRLGAFEAAVAHLRGPMRRGRPTRTHAPRIEFGGFDPPTFLVGFATAKRRGFELERSVSPARGDDAIGDVRAVEPMMGDRDRKSTRLNFSH